MNLPARVSFGNSNSIEYIYDAMGIKLRQIVHEGQEVKTTDYAGVFIYENSELQFIQHDEGRAVRHPELVSGSFEYEYQYHLTDHLGNVRNTFTTSPPSVNYLANFEIGSSDPADTEMFNNVDNIEPSTAANTTDGGNKAVFLNKDYPSGPFSQLAIITNC